MFFHTQSLNDPVPIKDNRYPRHIALFLGDNKFIHAKASVGKVVIESLFDDDYLDILIGYKDLIPFIITFEEDHQFSDKNIL